MDETDPSCRTFVTTTAYNHMVAMFIAKECPIKTIIDDPDKCGTICNIIHNMTVQSKDVLNLVCLLSSLTYFKTREKGDPLSFEHVVPKNVVEMSSESRVHSGE